MFIIILFFKGLEEFEPCSEILSAWKKNGNEHYFSKISETNWAETVDGRRAFKFDFVERNGDKVVLFAADRDFYLKIDSSSVRFGQTKDKADENLLYEGKWLNFK